MPELPSNYSTPSTDTGTWPLSKFSFEVSIGGFDGKLAFQAMDGLGASITTMKFRDGNSPMFYEQSRPTLTTYEPVTLKKGVFVGDSTLFNWFKNVSQGALFSDMRTVTIALCELQGGNLTQLFNWTLDRAYITKFTPSGLDAEADGDIAVEEVEITYQSFSMEAGGLLGALSSLGGIVGTAARVASSIV